MIGEEPVNALRRIPVSLFGLELQPHVNAADDQNVVFGLNLAFGLGDQPRIRRIDLTRFQRASKGARQSTGRGRHNVV